MHESERLSELNSGGEQMLRVVTVVAVGARLRAADRPRVVRDLRSL